MGIKDNGSALKYLSLVYFGFTLIIVVGELLSYKLFVCFFRLSIIPLLMVLYYISSKKKNGIYFMALFFSFMMNLFFLKSTLASLFYGQIAYAAYRFLTVVLVFKIIKEAKILSLVIAVIPFVSVFSYLLVLVEKSLLISIYPSVVSIVLMSVLGGVSLSNYVFNDNKKNTFFLISCLLFTSQIFVFAIQKHFSLDLFLPIGAVIYSVSNYIFFRFLIEYEKEDSLLDLEVQD
jgi:hypothetical protein